ncbi:GSCOCG00005981001-RA-CDS [Cotesia congregata]|nr:GSCOCG00005981001-RA-CDS [Cotesia congregata]
MIRSYFYLPYINDFDNIFSVYNRFDLLGEYLAYIISHTREVNLLNIKTGEQLMRPIFLEVSNDQLELNRIQIWLTEDQKIILLIKWIHQILIFNAEDGRQYVTPPVFTNLNRDNQIVSRKFENEVIIVVFEEDVDLLTFFQLEFNNQDEIIAKEILRITQPIAFHYEYEKIYHEKRKIMVVFNAISTRVDETNLRKRFCRATIVRLPLLITKPINIDSRDKRYSMTLVRKFDVNRFEIFCSDSKILLLSREEEYPNTLRPI